MSKRKYKATNLIKTLADYENSKATWFEVRSSGRKMWHRGALDSLQVRTLKNFLYYGEVYECEPIEPYTGDKE